MPFLGSLGGLLLGLVGGLIGRALAALGIAFVTYYGVYEALQFIKDELHRALSYLPLKWLPFLACCKWARC